MLYQLSYIRVAYESISIKTLDLPNWLCVGLLTAALTLDYSPIIIQYRLSLGETTVVKLHAGKRT